MNIKDLQTDPLLAAMYTHDMWSQLAKSGSDNKHSCNMPVSTGYLFDGCALCEHFKEIYDEHDCSFCREFMEWDICSNDNSLYGKWYWARSANTRKVYAKRISNKSLKAAIRYIEEYEEEKE
jgi:hypothetical protein